MLAKGYMAIGGVGNTGAILPTKHCKRLIRQEYMVKSYEREES